MSRSAWRCRNRTCADPHGEVLGRLTDDRSSLVVAPSVATMRIYLDTGKVDVVCPVCGTVRTFRGAAVFADLNRG